MPPELLEQNPANQDVESSNSLSPALEDYGNYNEQNKSNNPASENILSSGKELNSSTGILIEPIFGRSKNPDSIREKTEEANDSKADAREHIDLNSEARGAKDQFFHILADRLKDDPQALRTLEAKMDEMDQRALHRHVRRSDGSFVDQQEQLTKEYNSLTRIATDAEKLTYTDKNGNEQKVYSQPWMVNNLLAGAIMRGADPIHNFNQGRNNTCAAESINRQGTALLIGEESQTVADMVTNGEFQVTDKDGKTFTCRVDRRSLVPDREARQMYLGTNNARDAYGQAADIRTAQANLDLMSRKEAAKYGQSGGEGRYVYKKVNPTSQSDSGERVVHKASGKVIADSPCMDAESTSDVKQALFGRFIDENFGKETTLVSDRAFGHIANVTALRSGKELNNQLEYLEKRGWDLPTYTNHVGHYLSSARGLGGAQGWHAASIKLGSRDLVNNWGGKHDYKNMSADTMFSWMSAPENASSADRQRGDHIFNPGGYGADRGNPVLTDLNDKLGNKGEPKLSQTDKDKSQEQKKEQARSLADYAKAQIAVLDSRLAGLSENDPERKHLLAQKELYESNIYKNFI